RHAGGEHRGQPRHGQPAQAKGPGNGPKPGGEATRRRPAAQGTDAREGSRRDRDAFRNGDFRDSAPAFLTRGR
ncbi:MAG: hypothetical protein AAGC69_19275, partial [Paracraurococcus sp.]